MDKKRVLAEKINRLLTMGELGRGMGSDLDPWYSSHVEIWSSVAGLMAHPVPPHALPKKRRQVLPAASPCTVSNCRR